MHSWRDRRLKVRWGRLHETLGPYRIVSELGQGAVGRVVAAVDERTGKHYAIKTLSPDARGISPRVLLDEAAVIVQLSHPNIVELVDVGREHDVIFVVMELVRGTSLREWSRAWPGTRAVLHAFDQILDALSAAHAQGVVHGDIKPGNVLLEASGRVKIADFGIARVIDPVRGTGERAISGTPYYMAPEQVFDPDDVGPPADLYAVGVMLRQLFGRESPRGTTVEMLERKLLAPAPFALRDGLVAPPALVELLDALLEPNPRKRPRFAAQVRRELAAIATTVEDASAAGGIASIADATLIAPVYATSVPASPALSDPSLAEAEAPESLVRRLRPVPLVARTQEIERLRSLERFVSEGGGPRALVIVGRAGDGKSRLARYGFANAERNGTMVGAAASYDELSQSASVDLRACLRRLLGPPRAGSTFEETLATRWSWLNPWLSEADGRALHEHLLPDAPPLDADKSAALATSALAAAARVRPIYLWLDDVAWSRDGAMPLVLSLLETDVRVLVVATVRSGTAEHPTPRAWLERVSKHPRATRCNLPSLTSAERAELMMAAGVAEPCAEALAPLLDHPTLVVVEAVRDWIEQGLLIDDGGDEWAPRAGVGIETLAEHAGGALARRVDALLASFAEGAERAERVLAHAALLGMFFDERALRACSGAEVDEVLDRTLLMGVLRVHAPGVYRFEHQLFVKTLLERLERRADRDDVRKATADAITSLYGTYRPELVARAAKLLRDAGAAEQAYAVAYSAAAVWSRTNLFARADEMIDEMQRWAEADGGGPTSLAFAHVHRAQGVRHYDALEYESSLQHHERSRAIFTRHGQQNMADLVGLSMASAYFFTDRLREVDALLAEIAPRANTPGVVARVHHRRAELAQLRGDLDGAIALQRRASASADALDSLTFAATVTLAELLYVRGAYAEAHEVREHFSRASARATRVDVADITESISVIELCVHGRFGEAMPHAEAWAASVRSRGDRWQLSSALAFVALCAAACAPEERAARAAREAAAAYRDVPHDELQVWWAIRSCQAWLRGRGMTALADEYGAVLDARQRAIADAFTR